MAAAYVVTRLLHLAGLAWTARAAGTTLREQLAEWDAQWMVRIASYGYFGGGDVGGEPAHWTTMAFFPGTPSLVRGVSLVTGLDPFLAGSAISALCGFAAAWAALDLARRAGFGAGGQVMASVLVTCAPMALTFLMPYTEGPYLALAGWALVAMLDRRWWAAGALAFLAGLTRPTALALFLTLFAAAAVFGRRDVRAWIAACVAPVGWVAYLAWASSHLADVGGWFGAQRRGWDTGVDWGASTLEFLRHALGESRESGYVVTAWVILAAAATLAWAWCALVAEVLGRRARGGAGRSHADAAASSGSAASRPRAAAAADAAGPFLRLWPVLVFSTLTAGQILLSGGLMHSRPRLLLGAVFVLVLVVPALRRLGRPTAWALVAAWVFVGAWVGWHMLVPFPWAI
ncbi:glycosyltransferase 87 family protein [Corynebacterium sp. 335C]